MFYIYFILTSFALLSPCFTLSAQSYNNSDFEQGKVISSEVKNICNSFSPVGTCKGDKIALVTYDVRHFWSMTNEVPDQRQTIVKGENDSDCYIVKEYLQKNGFCIEGIPMEHSMSHYDALEKNQNLKGRYSYIANISHGGPGEWVISKTKCEATAIKKCDTKKPTIAEKEKFDQCVDGEKASGSSSKECPCFKEYGLYLEFRDDYDKFLASYGTNSDENLVKQLPNKKLAVKNAETKFTNCAIKQANINYYAISQDVSIYGVLSKADATIFSDSCDTADSSENFREQLCSKAPEGVTFNLANAPVNAACIKDAATNVKESIDNLTELYCSGKSCTYEEYQKKVCEIKKTDLSKPIITQMMTGDFSCWKCSKQKAPKSGDYISTAVIMQDCNGFNFPDGVQRVKRQVQQIQGIQAPMPVEATDVGAPIVVGNQKKPKK